MARPRRIAIVGAGMIGAACAVELAGEVDLLVLDAGIPAGGATAACMGHVVVMDDSEAQFALTSFSRRLWDAWSSADGSLQEIGMGKVPDAVEREVCGTLWLASDADELELARAKHDYFAVRGVATELLDAESLRRAEPELRQDLAGALRVPGDSVVYPPAAVAWLLEVAARRSAAARRTFERRWGVRVRMLRAEEGAESGAVVELADGERLEVDAVVLAAGLASLDLLESPASGLRIRPRKGHLVITDRHPGFCHHQLVELGYLKSAHGDVHADADRDADRGADPGSKASEQPSVAFNLQPRSTGQLLVGSSRQMDVSDRRVESEVVRLMLRRAAEFLPRLGELQAIRIWTGVRPATDDHLPYLGPLPGRPAIVLAAGHEGLGITTAPGTAHLVAHHLLGRTAELDPRPYLPTRPGASE